MSTILKALRQLEEDRHRTGERSAGTPDGGIAGVARRPRRAAPSWIGAVLGLAGLGLLVAVLAPALRGTPGAGRDALQAPTEGGRESAAAPPGRAPAIASQRAVPAADVAPPSGGSAVSAAPEAASAAQARLASPPGSQTPAMRPPAASPPPAAVAGSVSRAPSAPAPLVEPPAPAVRTAAAAPTAVAGAAPARTEEAARATRAAAPEPVAEDVRVVALPEDLEPPAWRVARTRWHPRAERREALLQAVGGAQERRVREGDRIDGYVVEEIKPSSVRFAREGASVAVRVGSGGR